MEASVIQRVKLLIESRGVTVRGFASEIDFNYSTLNNYLTGRRSTIDCELPEKILLSFGNISAEWLMRGKGEMYISAEKENITGANNVTGKSATVIGQQVATLSEDFVRGLLAEKDKQIQSLLNLLGK